MRRPGSRARALASVALALAGMDAVVLPAGWVLANSSIPAVVGRMPDGRVRLEFVNPRPDEIAVLLTA